MILLEKQNSQESPLAGHDGVEQSKTHHLVIDFGRYQRKLSELKITRVYVLKQLFLLARIETQQKFNQLLIFQMDRLEVYLRGHSLYASQRGYLLHLRANMIVIINLLWQ